MSKYHRLSPMYKILFTAIGCALGSASCTKDQMMRMTYETLRQQDCHINSSRTDYCDRSYTFEYDEYKHLRQSYLAEIQNDTNFGLTHLNRISRNSTANGSLDLADLVQATADPEYSILARNR